MEGYVFPHLNEFSINDTCMKEKIMMSERKDGKMQEHPIHPADDEGDF